MKPSLHKRNLSTRFSIFAPNMKLADRACESAMRIRCDVRLKIVGSGIIAPIIVSKSEG